MSRSRALFLALLLSGCAGTALPPGAEPHPKDPWEGFNRKVFAFNDVLDESVVKPAAQAYQATLPTPVRDSVGNFFGNLSDAWSSVNWLLQGEFRLGIEQGARFIFNSTFGIVGLFDVAGEAGIEKRSQNFAQTLGAYGVGRGNYLVLPILGPSTVRDTFALPVDRLARSSVWFGTDSGQWWAAGIEAVHTRATLLQAGELVEGIALDKYTFFRDAYLQRTNYQKKSKRNKDDDEGFEVVAPTPAASAASAP